MPELHDRRRDNEAALIQARQAAGAAILSGKKPNYDELARLEAEHDAIQAAAALQDKQRHEQAEATQQAHRAELRQLLADHEKTRLLQQKAPPVCSRRHGS